MQPFELSDDPLRPKDLAVLRAIAQHCDAYEGSGPSLLELTARLGMRSHTAVRLRVHALARRGLVAYRPGQGGRRRSISVSKTRWWTLSRRAAWCGRRRRSRAACCMARMRSGHGRTGCM